MTEQDQNNNNGQFKTETRIKLENFHSRFDNIETKLNHIHDKLDDFIQNSTEKRYENANRISKLEAKAKTASMIIVPLILAILGGLGKLIFF